MANLTCDFKINPRIGILTFRFFKKPCLNEVS
jgi:hypothetical protein